jgi:hypothetical protein
MFIMTLICKNSAFHDATILSYIYSLLILLNSLIVRRYLESVFSKQHFVCLVEQFIKIISTINHLVRSFTWLGTNTVYNIIM